METSVALVGGQEESGYNGDLHERFVSWLKRTSNSAHIAAGMMQVSPENVHAYIEKRLGWNVLEFELRVKRHLDHQEYIGDIQPDELIVDTSCCNDIREMSEICERLQVQGFFQGPTGCGKSKGVAAVKSENPDTLIVSCDVTKRTLPAILSLVADCVGCGYWGKYAVGQCLEQVIVRLHRWPKKLMIIDDCHFADWECLEGLRTIYDRAKIGILYVGQQEFFDRLTGKVRDRKGRFIYDQILSRITLKRRFSHPVKRDDVKLIVDPLSPGLDKKCIDFLHRKASRSRDFRVMTDLLKVAKQIAEVEGVGIDLALLRDANRYLEV